VPFLSPVAERQTHKMFLVAIVSFRRERIAIVSSPLFEVPFETEPRLCWKIIVLLC